MSKAVATCAVLLSSANSDTTWNCSTLFWIVLVTDSMLQTNSSMDAEAELVLATISD